MIFSKKLTVIGLVSGIVFSSQLCAANIYKDDINEFDLGGRVELRGNVTDGDHTDKSRARLNFEGRSKLNENLTAFAYYESELTEDQEDHNADFETRHLYIGADTSIGTIVFGHQDNAVTYLTNFTDIAETFSGYINENTQTSADRSKNTLRYIFNGEELTFQGSATKKSDNNAEGFGLMLAYQLTSDIEIAFGMATSLQEYGLGTQTERSNSYMIGAKYTKDGIYLAFTASQGKISAESIVDSNFKATDAAIAYYFGNKDSNCLNLNYSYYSADDIKALDTNFVALEYAHYIYDFALYGSYKIALSGDRSDSTFEENQFQFGARYSF